MVLALALVGCALGCTNVIVTPGASVDGSTMISYNADSHTLYGELYHWAHATWPANSTVEIVEWDTGVKLGKIAQVPETYNVVGNVNEYQVAIGETTFGGIDPLLAQPKAVVDYGSLIYLALQRSKTAREAISVMTSLVAEYGYYSEGESFSIGDTKEAWILEMIGKGEFELGAVWVAVRIPDGYISGHANQARIQKFPRNDPANCVYSPDVVSFAKAHGFYPATAPDADFSFSDVYNPVAFEMARGCEGRVWSVFRKAAGAALMDPYTDYVLGTNLKHRMPLYVKPTNKLSLNDTFMFMRDHFEGTALAFTEDLGADAFNAPYRWRPLTWQHSGKTYINERAIATQQTGWGYVSQLRAWIPAGAGGAVNWFSVDDTSCTVYFPAYAVSTRIPRAYATGNGAMMDLRYDSAFWAFNLVSNLAYTRWRLIYPEVFATINTYEAMFIKQVADTDAKAQALFKTDPAAAVELLTDFTVKTGDQLAAVWLEYFKFLFTRFMDGNVKAPNPGHRDPSVAWPGYGDTWYGRIVADTGDHYLVPDANQKTSRSARYL
jgi:dipeptidase